MTRFLWLVFVLFLVGCVAETQPFPTRAVLAEMPATFTPTATAIPTNTPQPTPTPLPTHTPTNTPTVTPLPTSTAIPTSTPLPTATPTNQPTNPPTNQQPSQGYTAPPVIRFYDTPPSSVPCGQFGLVFRSQILASSDGQWHSYHAYLPPCYGLDGRVYPVIYLLHGSAQTDTHWLDIGLRRLVDNGINAGTYPPMIIIMPNSGAVGNITSGGSYSTEGVIVNDVVPYVDRNFCTWAGRGGRGIGGISRGGYWALEIAFRNSGMFRGVSGHSSHLRYETDSATYNPLSTYVNAGGLRIWLDTGDEDFLLAGQEWLHNNLVNAGIPHEWHVNPGTHYDGYWAKHLWQYIGWHTQGWSRDRSSYGNC